MVLSLVGRSISREAHYLQAISEVCKTSAVASHLLCGCMLPPEFGANEAMNGSNALENLENHDFRVFYRKTLAVRVSLS